LADWESYDGGVTTTLSNYTIPSVNGSNLGANHDAVNTPTQVSELQTASRQHCVSVIVNNGGHTWPGHPEDALHGADGITAMNFDASELLGRFFMSMVAK
jgi:poly(3-hydroxybutyrate) depolymerase